jgi:hypothetical protein
MKTHLRTVLVAVALLACDRPVSGTRTPDDMLPTAGHVQWVEVDTDADGKIAKCTVYHDRAGDVPQPVHELAARKFPQAKKRYFETELYAEWGLVYEVELETADGRHCEVAGKPDGTELYTECEIRPEDIPAPVQQAVRALLPGGELREAEEKRGPSIDEVDLQLQVGDELHYIRYQSDGTKIQHLVRIRGEVEVKPGSRGS